MISVIIPIYNSEAYLERCLTSVIQNTYQNLQILCVDDGSTDRSPEILSRYAASDPRITVLTQPNSGVSQARNLGLQHALGDYVCFVDSDDWVHREYFAVLHRGIVSKNADMAVVGYSEVYRYAQEDAVSEIPEVAPRILSQSEYASSGFVAFSPWGRIFRRCRLEGLSFPKNIHFAEDQIFNICFFSRLSAPTIVSVDVPLYFYFQRPGSLVRSTNPERFLVIAQWYLDHMAQFQRRDLLLAHTYRELYLYRYEGFFIHKKSEVRKKARAQFRRAFPYLLKEPGFTFVEKVKYLVARISPALYRAQLLAKDPTYREVEKILKSRATHH